MDWNLILTILYGAGFKLHRQKHCIHRKKVQNSIKDKEEAGRSKAKKIQEMQGAMQKAAFEAAKSVAAAQQS